MPGCACHSSSILRSPVVATQATWPAATVTIWMRSAGQRRARGVTGGGAVGVRARGGRGDEHLAAREARVHLHDRRPGDDRLGGRCLHVRVAAAGRALARVGDTGEPEERGRKERRESSSWSSSLASCLVSKATGMPGTEAKVIQALTATVGRQSDNQTDRPTAGCSNCSNRHTRRTSGLEPRTPPRRGQRPLLA